MAHTLKFNLSKSSIKETINKLNKLQNDIEDTKLDIIEEACKGAVEVILEHTPIDTGATASSTHYEINGKKATISQIGDHVFENEYGDGILRMPYPGGNLPRPPTHTGKYTFVPDDPSSKYYHIRNGKPMRMTSYGQYPNAQMYHGGQYIKNIIELIAKREVGEVLSKI